MAKEPPNVPGKGDRCRNRGWRDGDPIGTVVKVSMGRPWATIKWDNSDRPMMCHLWGLEIVPKARGNDD